MWNNWRVSNRCKHALENRLRHLSFTLKKKGVLKHSLNSCLLPPCWHIPLLPTEHTISHSLQCLHLASTPSSLTFPRHTVNSEDLSHTRKALQVGMQRKSRTTTLLRPHGDSAVPRSGTPEGYTLQPIRMILPLTHMLFLLFQWPADTHPPPAKVCLGSALLAQVHRRKHSLHIPTIMCQLLCLNVMLEEKKMEFSCRQIDYPSLTSTKCCLTAQR